MDGRLRGTHGAVKLTQGKKTLACIAFEGFETLGLWTPAGKRAGCPAGTKAADRANDSAGV